MAGHAQTGRRAESIGVDHSNAMSADTDIQFEAPWTHEGVSRGGEPIALTDLGNAYRLALASDENVHYDHESRKWIIWNGHRWAVDSTGEIYRIAKKTVQGILLEAALMDDADIVKRLLAHELKSESARALNAMISLAQSEKGIPKRLTDFDREPMLLNCLNGTLDLQTGKMRQHCRADFLMKATPVAYDPGAICPHWNQFLKVITDGNVDLVAFLRCAAGYSLTGDISEHVLFLLYGRGANGKSVFLETLRYILGDYAATAEFESFMVAKNRPIRNDLARLRGSRFVVATESELGQRLAENVIKQMTGSDTVTARFLYSEHFEFRPEFKLWLATNHRPRIVGQDDGIWRRIRLIPCPVSISKDQQDHHLADKLKCEASGILNWALGGLADWLDEGLREPEAVEKATSDYRQDQDTVNAFLHTQCIQGSELEARAYEVYLAYKNWASEVGEWPVSKRDFANALNDRGYKKVKIGQRVGKSSGAYWKGMSLARVPEDEGSNIPVP
jgi:putative DNA primase/helicase